MKIKKKIIQQFLIVLSIVAMLPLLCYAVVAQIAKGRLYEDCESVPYNEVGMVLGTGPTTITGDTNYNFFYRIDAVEELYKAGKIKFVLISGDNSRVDYSEPDIMRDSLVARGIPRDVIYLDYAGFRTLDSVVRSKKVFGQHSLTVISQRFHNERSIVLGDWLDMALIGYNAEETLSRSHRMRAHIREGFARVKLFVDIMVGKQPMFLGEPIEIEEGKPQLNVNRPL
jgi:SanA protein